MLRSREAAEAISRRRKLSPSPQEKLPDRFAVGHRVKPSHRLSRSAERNLLGTKLECAAKGCEANLGREFPLLFELGRDVRALYDPRVLRKWFPFPEAANPDTAFSLFGLKGPEFLTALSMTEA